MDPEESICDSPQLLEGNYRMKLVNDDYKGKQAEDVPRLAPFVPGALHAALLSLVTLMILIIIINIISRISSISIVMIINAVVLGALHAARPFMPNKQIMS